MILLRYLITSTSLITYLQRFLFFLQVFLKTSRLLTLTRAKFFFCVFALLRRVLLHLCLKPHHLPRPQRGKKTGRGGRLKAKHSGRQKTGRGGRRFNRGAAVSIEGRALSRARSSETAPQSLIGAFLSQDIPNIVFEGKNAIAGL